MADIHSAMVRIEFNAAVGDLGIIPDTIADLFIDPGDAADRLSYGGIVDSDLARRVFGEARYLRVGKLPTRLAIGSVLGLRVQRFVNILAPGEMLPAL